jgi:minimal PKS chain-length factor (CLF/KS beta)
VERRVSAPVVVTGVSVAAPNGLGTSEYWSATLRAASGIAPITRFDPAPYPVRLAGEIRGFEPAGHVPGRLMPQTDHMTRLALAATDWAIADAAVDLTQVCEYAMGVSTACASGGTEFGQRELENLWGRGWKSVSAYMSFAWYYAVNTGQISIRHGMRGPGGVVAGEQAGGLDAVAHARRQIRKGTRLMISGGMDSALCPSGLVTHMTSQRLSRVGDPRRAYLPFDADASGYVFGEGGAILVLEDAASAAQRDAPRVYGEIAGYAATFDPRPGPAGDSGLRRAADLALAESTLRPADIDVVFADAIAVPALDRHEAEVVAGLFGPYGVPVTAPKTMTGRLSSGGASLDIACALLAMRDGIIPPTANVTRLAAGCEIDLVTGQPRTAQVRSAMVLATGFGGFNAAMVLRLPTR